MFCSCYDHQTKKGLQTSPLIFKSDKRGHIGDVISRFLTKPGEDGVQVLHNNVLCMLLITPEYPTRYNSVLAVLLLLDQIKPIEQLVPVN